MSGYLLAAVVFKTTVILLLTLLLDRCIRRADPRWRVLAWRLSAVATSMMLLCGLAATTFSWSVKAAAINMPARIPDPSAPSPAPTRPSARTTDNVGEQEVTAGHERAAEHPAPATGFAVDQSGFTRQPSTTVSSETAPSRAAVQPLAQPEWPKGKQLATATWWMIAWGVGVFLSFMRLGWSMASLHRLAGRSMPVPDELTRIAGEVSQQLAHGRPFCVRRSAEIGGACVVAGPVPTILLSEQLAINPGRDCRAIIAHEVAHLRAADHWMNLVVRSSSCLYWFHPLAWLAVRSHVNACDDVADDVACEAVGDSAVFTRILARAALAEHRGCLAAGMSIGGRPNIIRRIRRLGEQKRYQPVGKPMRAWLQVSVVLLALCLGTFSPSSPTFTILSASAGGLQSQSNDHGNAGSAGASQEVTAKPPEAALAAEPAADGEDLRLHVRGVVTNAGGEPVAGARVFCSWYEGSVESTAVTTTDGLGSYRFNPGLLPLKGDSRIAVRAHAEGLGMAQQNFPSSHHGSINATIVLEAPGEMTLICRNESGEVVSGVDVEKIQDGGIQRSSMYLSRSWLLEHGFPLPPSDAEGRIKIGWLPPSDDYELVVRHSDYAWHHQTGVQNLGKSNAIELQSGFVVKLQVRCEHAPDAVKDAKIEASVSATSGHYSMEIPVDDSGNAHARFKNEYTTLRVQHPSLVAAPYHQLDPGSQVFYTFNLYREGRVAGRIVDANTREGAAGVVIRFAGTTHGKVSGTGRTDSSGNYEFNAPAMAGEVRVDTLGSAYQRDSKLWHVSVLPDETVRVPDIALQRLPPVHLRVTGPDGRPVPNAYYFTDTRSSGMSDAQGEFQLQGTWRQVNVFDLSSPLCGVAHKQEQAAEETVVQIRLGSEAEVTGKVIDPSGIPAPGIRVRWRGNGGGFAPHDVTDAEGRFRLAGLPLGTSGNVSVQGELGAKFSDFSDTWSRRIEISSEQIETKPITVARKHVAANRELTRRSAPSLFFTTAPSLTIRDWHNSPPLSLDSLRGGYVLLNYWGTWCGPCYSELDDLQVLHEQYSGRGLTVIGVHTHEYDAVRLKEVVEEYGLEYPMAVDVEENTTAAHYQVRGFPENILIDPQGKPVAAIDRDALVPMVRSYLVYGEALDG